MLSTVALVGRPNVGKSTLFNRLTRSRDALVADFPGVTRDRRYGLVQDGDRRFLAVDTGGLGAQDQTGLAALIEHQVELALNEADVIVLVVDCREGLTAEDQRIAGELRRIGKPLILAVNKSEGQGGGIAEAEFHALGVGEPCAIAARSGQGISHLLELLGEYIAPGPAAETEAANGPTIAVIGRPNVGKSTLINRLLGADRLVTSNVPGTTRDSVMVQCERDGRRFVMVDTAGVRRRARVTDAIEKYSIVQTLQAIGTARVVILLIDATEGITDQDLHLLGLALDQGRAIVIGLNKWDGLPTRTRTRLLREVDRQLSFLAFADVLNISALHGSGIAELLEAAFRAYRNAGVDLTTPDLNAILARILEQHPPPLVRGRRPKLRYVHQGGKYPPTIVIHGGQLEKLPQSYTRYLENAFRGALRLRGTPLRIELRTGENPFAGRRNKLTPRQERRRKRVISHGRRK